MRLMLSPLTIHYLFTVLVELECHLSFMVSITTDGDTFVSDCILVNLDEPANYKEAMTGPEVPKWK